MPEPLRAASHRGAASLALLLLGGQCTGGAATTKGTTPPPDTSPITEPGIDTGGIDSAVDTGTVGPVFDCYSNVSIEEDGDASPDGSGYDGWDADNPTWQLYLERDYNGNGVAEQFSSWERDEAGRVLRYEQWGSSVGAYDATYDADGNRLTYDEDTDSDGIVDLTYRYTYENGALVYYERDDGADGVLDYTLSYVRDAEGRRLSAEADEDGDGIIDISYAYTIDDQGREVEIATDEGNDGVLERVSTTVYTDPILKVGTTTTEDVLAGDVLQITDFAYDTSERELYYGLDIPPFGVLDYERWSDRNADGDIVHYRLLTSLYGDQLELDQDLVRDGLGRLTEVHTVVTNLAAGTVDSDVTYTYLFGGTCPSP
jgi:hypothetical protein